MNTVRRVAVVLVVATLAGVVGAAAQDGRRPSTRGRDKAALAVAISQQVEVLKSAIPLPPTEPVAAAMTDLDTLLAEFLLSDRRDTFAIQPAPRTVPADELETCQRTMLLRDKECKSDKASLCRRCVCQGKCP
jgi:hypothetical protein